MGNNKSRRKFSKAFKQRTVQMCEVCPAAEVAESLGISSGLLHKWKTSAIEEVLDAFRAMVT